MTSDFKKEVMEIQERLKGRTKLFFGEDIFVPEPHMVSIKANHLDDLYNKIIYSALEHERINYIDRGSHAGQYRLEFDHANLIIPNQRHPEDDTLAPKSRPGLPEVADEKGIYDYFNDYLIKNVIEDSEHYGYNVWIVGMKEGLPLKVKDVPRGADFNQLEWCANYFVEKGYGNNHCYITIGSADSLKRYGWPYKDETDRGTSECLRGISFKIRDNKLNTTCFFRSWDAVGGTPKNLGGISLLSEYFTDIINTTKRDDQPEVSPRTLIANSDGLHIYESEFDVAKLKAGLS